MKEERVVRKKQLFLGKNRNLVDILWGTQNVGVVVATVGLFTFLAIANPYFLTSFNILNVLRQISVIGILCVGQTILMISGELDLSVGATLSLCACVAAALAIRGFNPWLSAIVGIGTGGALGLSNGLLVTKVKINALIVTLGMLSVSKGFALLVTQAMPIAFRYSVSFLGSGYILQIPVPVVLMFFLVAIGHIVLRFTVFGRRIFAVGGNPRAARLSGMKVEQIKVLAFVLMGVLTGLAGIVFAGILKSADPIAGVGFELQCIAAVVIGGTTLGGGKGSVIGALLGAALMGLLRNGFVLLRVSAYWQVVTIGAVLIGAITLDRLKRS